MRDTSDIDDRVASKYYLHMFNETLLPRRFPIGKEKIVLEASAEDLRRFYDTHYYPANMHLFVVGDIDPQEMVQLIEKVYGPEPMQPRTGGPVSPQPAIGLMHTWPMRGAQLVHEFYQPPAELVAEVRHSQLTSFFMSMTMKEALESNNKYRHIFEEFLDSLVGMALDSRSQEVRSQLGDPPFYSLDWSYLNSPREGCVLNSLTVHGEARKWQSAVVSAVNLVSSLVRYGLAPTELQRLVLTLMRQFELDAEQYETQESSDVMARLQECAEAGDAFMTPMQRLQLFQQVLCTRTRMYVHVSGRVHDSYATPSTVPTGPAGGHGRGRATARTATLWVCVPGEPELFSTAPLCLWPHRQHKRRKLRLATRRPAPRHLGRCLGERYQV
jgi:zinc protease